MLGHLAQLILEVLQGQGVESVQVVHQVQGHLVPLVVLLEVVPIVAVVNVEDPCGISQVGLCQLLDHGGLLVRLGLHIAALVVVGHLLGHACPCDPLGDLVFHLKEH